VCSFDECEWHGHRGGARNAAGVPADAVGEGALRRTGIGIGRESPPYVTVQPQDLRRGKIKVPCAENVTAADRALPVAWATGSSGRGSLRGVNGSSATGEQPVVRVMSVVP